MHTFLTQTAEYALRAMAWIASRSPDEPILARDLSEGTHIPVQYLSKILRRLVLAGVLESRKGRGGGFTLARPPGRISFREILQAVDAYPVEDRCAFGWGACDPAHPCPLHDSWTRMSAAFQEWAATTTLAQARDVSIPRPVARRRAKPRARRSPAPPEARSTTRPKRR